MDVRSGRNAEGDAERTALAADLRACRAATLALFQEIAPELFRRQLHTLYSPLGWHLGHIAYTEARWLHGEDNTMTTSDLRHAFAVDGLAKSERTGIPDAPALFDSVARVRRAPLVRLAAPASPLDLRLWRFVLQHEAQHAETASFLQALARRSAAAAEIAPDTRPIDDVVVPGGLAAIGDDGADALDNERDPHAVALRAFRLARTPVTQAQFAAFVADGGYARRTLWSDTD